MKRKKLIWYEAVVFRSISVLEKWNVSYQDYMKAKQAFPFLQFSVRDRFILCQTTDASDIVHLSRNLTHDWDGVTILEYVLDAIDIPTDYDERYITEWGEYEFLSVCHERFVVETPIANIDALNDEIAQTFGDEFTLREIDEDKFVSYGDELEDFLRAKLGNDVISFY